MYTLRAVYILHLTSLFMGEKKKQKERKTTKKQNNTETV